MVQAIASFLQRYFIALILFVPVILFTPIGGYVNFVLSGLLILGVFGSLWHAIAEAHRFVERLAFVAVAAAGLFFVLLLQAILPAIPTGSDCITTVSRSGPKCE